jgi:DNA-binding NarL/FixJ family response regulator
MPTRVLIADDFELMRRNLRNLLAETSDIAVCGEAGD